MVKKCERCHKRPPVKTERFCVDCRDLAIAEMIEAGYLEDVDVCDETEEVERVKRRRPIYTAQQIEQGPPPAGFDVDEYEGGFENGVRALEG